LSSTELDSQKERLQAMQRSQREYPFPILTGACLFYAALCFFSIMSKCFGPGGLEDVGYPILVAHFCAAALVGLWLSYAGKVSRTPSTKRADNEGEPDAPGDG